MVPPFPVISANVRCKLRSIVPCSVFSYTYNLSEVQPYITNKPNKPTIDIYLPTNPINQI